MAAAAEPPPRRFEPEPFRAPQPFRPSERFKPAAPVKGEAGSFDAMWPAPDRPADAAPAEEKPEQAAPEASPPEEIRAVISRAVTDSGREIVFSDAPEKAGVNNLLEIYELLTGLDRAAIEAAFEGKGYGALKSEVAEVVIEGLRPIRERYSGFMEDPSELDRILAAGAGRAAGIAEPKVREIKYRVGFIVPPTP